MTVKEFIDSLDGTVAVAEAIGAPVSTVSGWNISNAIPAWRMLPLRELAKEKGVRVPAKFTAKPNNRRTDVAA